MKHLALTSLAVLCAFGVTNVLGGSYLGCYRDSEARIWPLNEGGKEIEVGPTNSPYKCSQSCQGYDYFGVQANQWCWCSNTAPPESRRAESESECYKTCPGDSNNKCGGQWRMNIYQRAKECVIEENVQYWSTNADTLDDGNGKMTADSASECKELCEATFPNEAKFFVYNDEDAQVKKKWRSTCRCKKDQGTRKDIQGVYSGNLFCGTQALEPPARWRSPTDWKCGKNNMAPNGKPGICNPTSHAPCCSTHGWCGSDKVCAVEGQEKEAGSCTAGYVPSNKWCGNGGTDFRLVDDWP